MSLRSSLPGAITAVFVAGLAVAQTTPQPPPHELATRRRISLLRRVGRTR